MEVEACRALIALHYPGLIRDGQTITAVEDGWDSLVLDIDDTYIFRFPRRIETIAGYKKEAALLPALVKVLSCQVPRFEFICLEDMDPSRCFVGYRKIHGIQLSVEIAALPLLARELANFLDELHSFPRNQAEKLTLSRSDVPQWKQTYQDFYSWVQANVYPMVEKPARLKIAALWESFLSQEINFEFEPVLIHRDLCGDHILCNARSPFLSGVIDWEDAMLGDPAFDFVGLLYIGGQNFLERVLGDYHGAVDETFLNRIAFYLAAIPFHQIRFGLQTGDESHVHEGLSSMPGLFSLASGLASQQISI